jgi:hypothetical protein
MAIEESRTVEAEPARLWALVADLERWAELLPTVDAVRRLDGPGEIGVGSRFELRQPGLPRAVYEVREWAPGRSFTWIATAPGVTTVAVHAVTPLGSGSLLALRLEWRGPLAVPVRWLYGAKTARMVAQEADTFARLA